MWFEDLTAQVMNAVFRQAPRRPPPGLLLGYTLDSHDRVVFADPIRCQHAVVLGKSGSGKTYLLESLATQLAERGEGFAFLDFHGDASLSLISRLLGLPNAADRLVILDPSHATRSPGINVLEASHDEGDRFRRVSELSTILRQRWGVDAFGARTEELLRNSLYTLAANGGTLADLPALLTDTPVRRAMCGRLEHADIQAYWSNRYEPLSEAMKGAFREPLLNKVTGFLTEPAARHLLGQPTSTIDVSRVIARQQWLILRLPKGRLREHAHTLGNLVFAQVQFALLGRDTLPPSARHTFTLLCDEAQNLAENDLQTLLTEGRKFGCSVISANQYFEQLPKELRGALLSAHSHLCFRVNSTDAHIFAGELSLERRHRLAIDLTQLSRGEAVGRLGHDPVVRFRVPTLPRVSSVSRARFDELIAPVTRDRREIEQTLRRTAGPLVASDTPIAAAVPVEEGQDAW